jgi:ribose transport system ATP-binding protein
MIDTATAPDWAPTAVHARLIELEGVTKSFGGVRALRGVHFDLKRGEVHALLGQNGAGKSTLIKILAGVLQRDGGRILIDGGPVEFRSSAEARALGLGVVYQDLSLIPGMSIADNLFLAREHNSYGLLQRRRMQREAMKFINEHGLGLNPSTKVEDLPFAYRQLTEIAKALSGKVRILVLDEPTSALSKGEEAILFDAVRQVTARGVGVIYITHRLSEVFQLSDRVTVLRDGRNAGTFDTADTDMETLVEAIVGSPFGASTEQSRVLAREVGPDTSPDRSVAQTRDTDHSRSPAPATLELRDVRNADLHGVSLEIREGEILGIAGMIGSGRTELMETIFGLRRIAAGELLIGGRSVRLRDAADAIGHGIGLVPEDRHLQGLVLEHSIERNYSMPWLDTLARWGMHLRRRSTDLTAETIRDLSVKAPGPGTPVRNLSGGNQQKVVFGRWRESGIRLLLLDEPTVGVDVGAREQIYAVVRRIVHGKASALVVSSDLAELLLLCDRIAIMAEGRIRGVLRRAEIRNEEHLHHLVQEPPE